MKHLKTQFPESKVAKKRDELDRLASSYTTALCGYLPTIDHTETPGQGLADDILTLIQNIAEVQAKIDDPYSTRPHEQAVQGESKPVEEADQPTGKLTDEQREYVKRLCQRYGIGVFQESGNPTFYISHPSLGDTSLQAATESNLYNLVCELAYKEQEKQAQ